MKYYCFVLTHFLFDDNFKSTYTRGKCTAKLINKPLTETKLQRGQIPSISGAQKYEMNSIELNEMV